ncbi:hypothetical protein EJ04DRAFT_599705 [Polyplosphaeria fusca]|uniref:Uncharacterized protein n=1 Tax=Polyplosphaeria fusca TaxID=682080 RepID=A0A9P4QKF0_9PLEO|nr:hypothetical protein EJ04DRAFT_599705 [Polyplosphaeria fusca]
MGTRYCGAARKRMRLSAEGLLRQCDLAIFKLYLTWRKEKSRIKKESAMDSYWNRIGMYYHHVTGYAMKLEVLQDVRNTLYAILHALWVDDRKPLPGFIRIQISLLLLLSAATATRPGALVESASNKGSNKALCFKDV